MSQLNRLKVLTTLAACLHLTANVTEIKRRIALAKKSFMNKKSIITNKVMSIESKKRFIKCFVWSVLLYGCEAWTIGKTTEKILMAMEMWCWKRMLRFSWTKKITNEKVLELAGKKGNLMETIRKRQLSFVGHIIRENGLSRRKNWKQKS